MQLKKKVVKSVAWLTAFQGIDQGVGFIRLLILTRFLTPEQFGYAGFAWLVLQIISTFTQPGIQSALIQRKKSIEEYLNPAWTFLLLRGLVLFFLVFLTAPLVSIFFNDTNIVPIIRAISFTFAIESLFNIGMLQLQRDLKFNKQFLFLLGGSLADFAVTIVLAVLTRSVWAIVIGSIANSSVKLMLSYVLSSYRPKIDINLKKVRELNKYGKWIFGSSIFQFIYSQGDDILVGRILGAVPLGLYQTAYKISNMPTTQVTYVLTSVLFPALSKIQDDLIKTRFVYLRLLQLTVFLSFLIGSSIMIFAADFVSLFLGSNWIGMIVALQILTIWGVVRSIGATAGPLLQAIGNPKTVTTSQFFQVIILVLLFFPLTYKFGIEGSAIAVVLSSIFPTGYSLYMACKAIRMPLTSVAKEITFPIVTSSISFVIIFAVRNLLPELNVFLFVIECVMYVLTYLAVTFILDRLLRMNLMKNFMYLVNVVPLPNTWNRRKVISENSHEN